MNVINLFSGCGGCSLGLKRAGFEIKLSVDFNKDACETYALNLGNEPVRRLDLTTASPQSLLAETTLEPPEVDIVVGGPPCQGFSSAGTKRWSDPRNTLLRNFVETVVELKPTWFVMENVEGLLTAKEGFFFTEAVVRFLDAGYWVRAKKVYMEQYGLPQRRKRVFLVGNLEQCEFDFPPPTHNATVEPTLLDANSSQQRPVSLLEATDDLPPATESGEVFYPTDPRNEYQARLRRGDEEAVVHHKLKLVDGALQERISLLSQGQTMRDLPEELWHPSFRRRAYRRVKDGTPTERRGGAPSGLKRLFAHNPALTVTSASPNEFVHPLENRTLTLRECARLQSFPDWFEFRGSHSSAATQVGNAIPPAFAELLANHISSLATWHRETDTEGRWLGVDATKSNGMSPALLRTLADLKVKTSAYV